MHGWMGTILRIDLTEGTIKKESLPEDFAKKYIGGAGFGTRILWDEVGPEVKVYDPENKLIFAVGPLNGTLIPSSGRFNIVTKSALTGGFGDSSIGGSWGPEMKYAGYDAMIIQGKAEKPVYVWIDDDNVEIRNANHLWGQDVWKTEDELREEIGDPSVAVLSIGPAGENLVRGACPVCNRSRVGGWGGCGPVMGSKNLKAIVVRGSKSVTFADPKGFIVRNDEVIKEMWESPTLKGLSEEGMPGLTPVFQTIPTGTTCSYNWKVAKLEEDKFELCAPAYLKETQYVKSKGCFSCPIHCSHWLRVKDGKYAGTEGEGFEWNAQGESFKMGIFNQEFMTKFNNVVNYLGLDIDEPACSIAWAMECYENGILTKEDTGGLDLTWGNEEVVLELLHMIAYRKGFGDLLAEGTYAAAMKVGQGSERYLNTGKGNCEARWDHRWGYGWALGQAVSTRGPDHLKGCMVPEFFDSREMEEALGLPTNSLNCEATEGKGELTVYGERISILCDAVTMCKFPSVMNHTMIRDVTWASLIKPVTGWDITTEEIIECADRINALQKAYNVRCGIGTRDHDFLPRRIHEDPIDTSIPIIPRDVLEKMKDDYYAARGWDVATGLPTRKSLEKLGLKDVADDLEKQLNRKL